MRTLEEARDILQISQEEIDFLVSGIKRVGEPIAVIAYGSRARGEAGKYSDYDILGLSELTGKELKEFSIAAHVQLRRFGKDWTSSSATWTILEPRFNTAEVLLPRWRGTE